MKPMGINIDHLARDLEANNDSPLGTSTDQSTI